MAKGEFPCCISKVTRTPEVVNVGEVQFPWAKRDKAVQLCRVEQQCGRGFYFGSAVDLNPDLEKQAQCLTKSPHDQHRVNYEMWMMACEVANGRRDSVPQLKCSVGEQPIFYAKPNCGARVYFTVLDGLSDPALIKIAACTKNTEQEVVKTLSYSNKKI